jgi:hypothetical protein
VAETTFSLRIKEVGLLSWLGSNVVSCLFTSTPIATNQPTPYAVG